MSVSEVSKFFYVAASSATYVGDKFIFTNPEKAIEGLSKAVGNKLSEEERDEVLKHFGGPGASFAFSSNEAMNKAFLQRILKKPEEKAVRAPLLAIRKFELNEQQRNLSIYEAIPKRSDAVGKEELKEKLRTIENICRLSREVRSLEAED